MNEDYLRINEQGLVEVNPMAGYNAQQEFIDNYRNAQAEKTAQIGEQTHALGSDLEAQYGGLHGPSEYWKSRYQTPQTESRLANLRATNQAQALNQLMKEDLEREAEKYNQAYKNYKKRAAARYNSGGGTGGNSTTTSSAPTTDDEQGGLDIISTTPSKEVGSRISTAPISGWSDTSFTDIDGRVHRVYTQGRSKVEYINGEKVFDNTDTGIGTQGGGSW